MSASGEIWILGATGRTGSAIARNLAARQLPTILVGRDRARLQEIARAIPGEPCIVVAETLDAILAEIARGAPTVVVNTIGPFASTAVPVARACPKGAHYVDLSNEVLGVTGLLGLQEEASAAGKCLVTGAGYGFVATESVVRQLCQGRPTPARVRVDTVPSTIEGGALLGEALAASIVDTLAGGGRRYEQGRLVRAPAGGDVEMLTLPDGTRVVTGSVPTGDLEGARRASGAPFVVAASSEIPVTPLARVMLPMLSALVSWRPARNWAVRRLARARTPARSVDRPSALAHARVEWSDGVIREGWLRAGDGMVFTSAVAAEVAARLARQEGRPGAFTPGALFGPGLAVAAGAEFVGDQGAGPARSQG